MAWAFTVGFCFSVAVGQQWPEFRGPNGKGIATAGHLPSDWQENNIRWRTPIPGRGWSSPLVADNEIWISSAEGEPADQRPVALLAICVDRDSGRIRRKIELFQIESPPTIHVLNSYASPTGALDERNAYFSFGTMGTCAVDRASGEVIWRNTELKLDHETGPGSSLALSDDLVIVNCDGIDQQYVVGLNKSDGKIAWKTRRSGEMSPEGMMQKAFSTPTLTTIDHQTVVLSGGANWLYCYDVRDGTEWWKVAYGRLGYSNVPRPLVDGSTIYITTGFTQPALLALDFDRQRRKPPAVRWSYERQVPTMPSPVVHEGQIFMVNDKGIATYLDALTGDVHWQHRLGGEFSSSPIVADGKIYVGNRDGKVFVLAPSRTYQLLSTNTLDAPIMATPAAVGSDLIFRTAASLYRICDAR